MLQQVQEYVTDHSGTITIWASLLALASSVGLVLFILADRRKAKGDVEKMAQRKAQLDSLYADLFGDMIFELLMKKVISRQEYKRDCRRFGVKYQLGDLLTRRNHHRAVDARVRKNVALMHTTPSPKLPREDQVIPPPVPQQRKRKLYAVVAKKRG